MFHPKVIHFPIAFLIGAFLFDLWGAIRGNESIRRAAWYQLILAFFFAIIAVITGLLAANNVPHNDMSHETMELHETLGYVIAGLLLVLFGWRWSQKGDFPQKGAIVYWAIYVIAVGVLTYSSDLGGKMVFEYGVAVKAVPVEEAGGHSHGGEGGHSHGEAAEEASHDAHEEAAPHSHEKGEDHQMPDQEEQNSENNTTNSQNKTGKTHTHDDGTVHQH